MLDNFGIIGAFLILIGYFGLQLQYFKHDNIYYDLINLFGALMLLYYAYQTNSLPFIILNFVWSAVALKDVLCFFTKKTCVK